MAVFMGVGDDIYGDPGQLVGQVKPWDDGWRATRPEDIGSLPSHWIDASRQFPSRREAVQWLLDEAGYVAGEERA